MKDKTYKLKDVYITWKGKEVRVVPKSSGVPEGDKYGWDEDRGYYDPSEWKGMTPAEFFLEQFTALTCGGLDPMQVDEEFSKIDEYEELDEKAVRVMQAMHRQRKAA